MVIQVQTMVICDCMWMKPGYIFQSKITIGGLKVKKYVLSRLARGPQAVFWKGTDELAYSSKSQRRHSTFHSAIHTIKKVSSARSTWIFVQILRTPEKLLVNKKKPNIPKEE